MRNMILLGLFAIVVCFVGCQFNQDKYQQPKPSVFSNAIRVSPLSDSDDAVVLTPHELHFLERGSFSVRHTVKFPLQSFVAYDFSVSQDAVYVFGGRLVPTSGAPKSEGWVIVVPKDPANGQLKAWEVRDRNIVLAGAVSHDGTKIVTAGDVSYSLVQQYTKSVCIHKYDTFEVINSFDSRIAALHGSHVVRPRTVRSVAMSNQQDLIAVGVDTGRVEVYQYQEECKLKYDLPGGASSICRIQLNSFGSLLASSSDDHVIRVWNIESGEHLWQSQLVQSEHDVDIAFSPCGRFLASSDMTELVLWEGMSGKRLATLLMSSTQSRPKCLSFSSDGQRLIFVTVERLDSGEVREKCEVWSVTSHITE